MAPTALLARCAGWDARTLQVAVLNAASPRIESSRAMSSVHLRREGRSAAGDRSSTQVDETAGPRQRGGTIGAAKRHARASTYADGMPLWGRPRCRSGARRSPG